MLVSQRTFQSMCVFVHGHINIHLIRDTFMNSEQDRFQSFLFHPIRVEGSLQHKSD